MKLIWKMNNQTRSKKESELKSVTILTNKMLDIETIVSRL